VFVEPVMGNAGFIPPSPGFLETLREVTRARRPARVRRGHDGFPRGLGGAQQRYGVTPDLTTLGKVIGAGLPVGAFGGRRDIMERVAPAGPIYQAGTLSGNPLATAAGNAQLAWLEEHDPYPALEAVGRRLVNGMVEALRDAGIPASGSVAGSMFGIFFHPGPVRSFEDAKEADAERFNRFHRGMLERGIFLAPSAFEAGFLSVVHGEAEINLTLDAARAVAAEVAGPSPA
jgi:glutamate-1-semialdehyde 2,1-aminomutase